MPLSAPHAAARFFCFKSWHGSRLDDSPQPTPRVSTIQPAEAKRREHETIGWNEHVLLSWKYSKFL